MIDLVMFKDFFVFCWIKSFSCVVQECYVFVFGFSWCIQILEYWFGVLVFECYKYVFELIEVGCQL